MSFEHPWQPPAARAGAWFVLALTGAEALHADMGQLARARPIRLAFRCGLRPPVLAP